jgi:tripartite-type tricarboxylate transporter receptor subunit TctC
LVLFLYPAVATAQEPAAALPKQIRIVVASVGGTGPDFIARLLAPRLGDGSRQSVIVDNRPGTNGLVAAQYTARAAADGSVIMMGNAGTHAINAALYRKPGYDPVTDFAAISEIASVPLALVVHPVVPAKSIKELIAVARKSPGKLNIAIAGAAGELTGNDLKLRSKIDMKNINYKGGAQAAIAVMSGEADMVFTTYVVISAHVDAGGYGARRQRRAACRSCQRPDDRESGLPGFEHEQWYALFAPANPGPGHADPAPK